MNLNVGESVGGIPLDALDPSTGRKFVDIMVNDEHPYDLMLLQSVPYAMWSDMALDIVPDSITADHIKDGAIELRHLSGQVSFDLLEGSINDSQVPDTIGRAQDLTDHAASEAAHEARVIPLSSGGLFNEALGGNVQRGLEIIYQRVMDEETNRHVAVTQSATEVTTAIATETTSRESKDTEHDTQLTDHNTRIVTNLTTIDNHTTIINTHRTEIDANEIAINTNATALTDHQNSTSAHPAANIPLDNGRQYYNELHGNVQRGLETAYESALAANTTADANAGSINTNRTNITTNTGIIGTNTAGVNTNRGNITTNTGTIGTNAAGVNTNRTNITTNSSRITSHTARLNTNEGNIDANATAITTNTGRTVTNATNISLNTGRIANLEGGKSSMEALAWGVVGNGCTREYGKNFENTSNPNPGGFDTCHINFEEGVANGQVSIQITQIHDELMDPIMWQHPVSKERVSRLISANGSGFTVACYLSPTENPGSLINNTACHFHWVAFGNQD